MGLSGSRVKDPNYIFRFCLIVFIGILGLGFVVFYNSQVMLVSEYQEMPVTKFQLEKKKENRKTQAEIANQLLKKELGQ